MLQELIHRLMKFQGTRIPPNRGEEERATTLLSNSFKNRRKRNIGSEAKYGMELRLPLEMSPGKEAACRAVFGTWSFFPNDARKNSPLVLTAFTGGSSERCPGIGFLSRGAREIGVLRNVEPPTRPRLDNKRKKSLMPVALDRLLIPEW